MGRLHYSFLGLVALRHNGEGVIVRKNLPTGQKLVKTGRKNTFNLLIFNIFILCLTLTPVLRIPV